MGNGRGGIPVLHRHIRRPGRDRSIHCRLCEEGQDQEDRRHHRWIRTALRRSEHDERCHGRIRRDGGGQIVPGEHPQPDPVGRDRSPSDSHRPEFIRRHIHRHHHALRIADRPGAGNLPHHGFQHRFMCRRDNGWIQQRHQRQAYCTHPPAVQRHRSDDIRHRRIHHGIRHRRGTHLRIDILDGVPDPRDPAGDVPHDLQHHHRHHHASSDRETDQGRHAYHPGQGGSSGEGGRTPHVLRG